MNAPSFLSGTFGSVVLARMRWDQYARVLGDDHSATRAALGRWLALRQWVPQRGLFTPEAIAWHRESNAAPGYLNRGERRAIMRLLERGFTAAQISRALYVPRGFTEERAA